MNIDQLLCLHNDTLEYHTFAGSLIQTEIIFIHTFSFYSICHTVLLLMYIQQAVYMGYLINSAIHTLIAVL